MLFRSVRCLIPDLTFRMTFKPLQTPSKIIHGEHYLLSFDGFSSWIVTLRDGSCKIENSVISYSPSRLSISLIV